MKNIYYIIFLLTITIHLGAQDQGRSNINDLKKFELGVNATNLLANLFSLNNESESVRYAFTSRYHTSNKWAWRLSLGGDIDQKSQNFGSSAFDYNYNARIGFEHKKSINKKLFFNFGFDVFAQYDYSDSKTNIDNITVSVSTKTNNLGLGPALRLEYIISDRVVLMTEGFFYGSRYSRTRTEFAGSTARKVENGFRAFLTEPTNLFISIKL